MLLLSKLILNLIKSSLLVDISHNKWKQILSAHIKSNLDYDEPVFLQFYNKN